MLELNASDARSKKILQEALGGVVGAGTLGAFVVKDGGQAHHISNNKRRVQWKGIMRVNIIYVDD